MATWNSRHDRGIDDAQAVEPANAQLIVNDRERV
jgi:hypothetical protein